MKPAATLAKINPSLFGWVGFHTEWKVDFNSYAVVTAEGVVFIDPLKPEPEVLEALQALGAPLAVVLTNAHHERDASWFRKKYDIQVYAHHKAQSDCDAKIDVLVMDGERLPGGLRTIYLPGVSTSEMALVTRRGGGIVLIGDAVMNAPGRGLHLLPNQYIEDRKLARTSLRKLLELNFETVTFAHGHPLTKNAKKRLAAFLK